MLCLKNYLTIIAEIKKNIYYEDDNRTEGARGNRVSVRLNDSRPSVCLLIHLFHIKRLLENKIFKPWRLADSYLSFLILIYLFISSKGYINETNKVFYLIHIMFNWNSKLCGYIIINRHKIFYNSGKYFCCYEIQ